MPRSRPIQAAKSTQVLAGPVSTRRWRTHARLFSLLAGWLALAAGLAPAHVAARDVPLPRVFLLDAASLATTRVDSLAGSAALVPALAQLRSAADKLLTSPLVSVVDKQTLPPSADRRDYTSLSIYWWPNPDTPDGLPYVNRDGRRNPQANDTNLYDNVTYSRMVRAVDTLSLAYYLSDNPRYAQQAARQLRTWFLEPTTRMNPNMRFAEIIPGRPAERGIGIIQSRELMRIVDDVGLLTGASDWTPADQAALQAWFAEFVTWLRESHQGQMESHEPNNHSTWYDAQVADFALFTGQDALAAEVLATVPQTRIAAQIEPDGSQPQELKRPTSFDYSAFNLLALVELATLGTEVGVDVWGYHTDDGRSIRGALDFMMPATTNSAPWPAQEIAAIDPAREMGPVLAHAALGYPDEPYGQALDELVAGQSSLAALELRLGAWALP